MTVKHKISSQNYLLDTELPFRVKVSFAKVVEFWEEKTQSNIPSEADHARYVLDQISNAPELRNAFDDFELLDKYEQEITLLLSPLFPELLKSNEIKAGGIPFLGLIFNASERFRKILEGAGPDFRLNIRDYDPDIVYRIAALFALQVQYGKNLDFKSPTFFDIPDAETGNMRYYRVFFNGDFSTFHPNENAVHLTEEDIQLLVDNFEDNELWKEKFPPNSYDFEGFALTTLFDVTADEALSALKVRLLERDAIHSKEAVEHLMGNVREYLNIPKFRMGLAAFNSDSHKLRSLGNSEWSSVTMDNKNEILGKDGFCDYSFSEVFGQHKNFVISDVSRFSQFKSPLIDKMKAHGVASFIIAPLMEGDQTIGFLELTSKTPNGLNAIVARKLEDLLPLFTVAVKRSITEYETNLEAIVQEQFTSIHSSVSWKFFNAAQKVLESRMSGSPVDAEEIVFPDVVPLFGQFDIRGSSTRRNESIQADIILQLTMAESVLEQAKAEKQLPIYDHLAFRIGKFKQGLSEEIHAGDEVKILEFLRKEIYPVFKYLRDQSEGLKKAVNKYQNALDPELKVVYRDRKKYEQSVTMLNEHMSEYIDKQQEQAQQMFPHFFEKYKTDGVEYNIYVGQSLLQNRSYHKLHLQNLRLWQLLVTCGTENLVRRLQEKLPMPLHVASLILAHNNPLSIKFRMDEKQFDVDGAYNIRYEIMKKRIDKAYIMNTQERLTQPGKLAIVYSQKDEHEEYMGYLEYMQSIGYLGEVIEDLDLEDLQGTTGLKALRVDFVYNLDEKSDIAKRIEALVEA